jgi:hypothetical protein
MHQQYMVKWGVINIGHNCPMCAALFLCQTIFLNWGSIFAQCVPDPFPINWNQAELVLAAESCQPFSTENRTADQNRRNRVPKRNGFIV